MGAVLANPKDFIAGKATAGFGGGGKAPIFGVSLFLKIFFFFFLTLSKQGMGRSCCP